MAEEFESRAYAALQHGKVKKLLASGQDSVIAEMPTAEDDYLVVYDTADGHGVRIRHDAKQYMLALRRPLVKGEKVNWYKNPSGPGVIQNAPSGSVAAYSETPVEVPGNPVQLATGGEAKTPAKRKRRRGARGARRRR